MCSARFSDVSLKNKLKTPNQTQQHSNNVYDSEKETYRLRVKTNMRHVPAVGLALQDQHENIRLRTESIKPARQVISKSL